ncbi:MAG: carboxypeptidase regulatory-like domain-containing protein [Acidobacteriota bacterium]|nr:MAG: carboxypeptidase regulatory-like domain-containing protein [Acidobacteriota bacterium]
MTRNTFRLAIALLLVGMLAQPTESYIRSYATGSLGLPITWNLANPDTAIVSNRRVTYSLSSAGSDDLPFNDAAGAIAASFQAWEDIPTSLIAFARGPNLSVTPGSGNGVLEVYWLESGTTTGDGMNVAGALAVSRLTTYTSGPRAGEIIDASLVFNGSQFKWAIDGRADAADIREVATHEIGHLTGLSHSPVGGSTMFPRSGLGRIQSRTLETDDTIAASIAYPAAGFLTSTGVLRGSVRDSSNAPIFGAHIAVVNGSGVVVAGGVSLTDGNYVIPGLPPGSYTVYAEAFDGAGGTYFSRGDLPSPFNNANVDFQTTGDFSVSIGAGGTTTRDFSVTRGTPAMDGYLVSNSTGLAFLNVPNAIPQGQRNVTIGVAGPGLPTSGNPISFSGSGVTILRTYFRTTGNGLRAVLADVDISPTAAPGSRNIIINNGSQRTIMTGGFEIISGSGGSPSLTVVSSANFAAPVAAESIVSAFGQGLANSTISATGNPLPTSLGGISVRLRDTAGNERLAPLFFVSPGQINYQIAPGILVGQATVSVTSGSSTLRTGSLTVAPVAPGLFSADATGKGLASAVVLRVRANGSQSFESAIRYQGSAPVAIPIDLGPSTDQVFLILFGTGIRFRNALPTATVGGIGCQVTFAGPQGSFTGLDQVNIRLDRRLAGRGTVNVTLTVDGISANVLTVGMK